MDQANGGQKFKAMQRYQNNLLGFLINQPMPGHKMALMVEDLYNSKLNEQNKKLRILRKSLHKSIQSKSQ